MADYWYGRVLFGRVVWYLLPQGRDAGFVAPTGVASLPAATGTNRGQILRLNDSGTTPDTLWFSGGTGSAGSGAEWLSLVQSAPNALTIYNAPSSGQVLTATGAQGASWQAAGGSQGPIGPTGSTGVQGPIGPTGATGATPAAAATRLQARLTAMGLLTQNWDPVGSGNPGALTLNTQLLYGGLVGLLSGDTITNIVIGVSTAAAGTTPTAIYAGLFSASGALAQRSPQTSHPPPTGHRQAGLSYRSPHRIRSPPPPATTSGYSPTGHGEPPS